MHRNYHVAYQNLHICKCQNQAVIWIQILKKVNKSYQVCCGLEMIATVPNDVTGNSKCFSEGHLKYKIWIFEYWTKCSGNVNVKTQAKKTIQNRESCFNFDNYVKWIPEYLKKN